MVQQNYFLYLAKFFRHFSRIVLSVGMREISPDSPLFNVYVHLFPGYRNEYQSGYGYNSASSSQMRGPSPWISGYAPSMHQSQHANYPSSDYQHHRNHYDNRQQSSRNITNYQNAQHGYHSQRGVCVFFLLHQ